MKNFKKICRMEQMKLKSWCEKLLVAKYGKNNVVNGDGFLYAKGNGKTPILLTAHMDTVHKEKCSEIIVTKVKGENNENMTILRSPQGIGGDDRCGVWMIFMILTKTKYRPSILFCEDEEIGGIGSSKFARTEYIKEFEELKYLVELDRANVNDAVYYDCGNEDFKVYIEKTIGYEEAYGSFSDIGHLSPACDKASVNLSCGYYKQHTLDEFVVFEEMYHTYSKVKELLKQSKDAPSFDYQEDKYNGWGMFSNLYSRVYKDDDYDYEYGKYSSGFDSYVLDEQSMYEVVFNGEDGKEDYFDCQARSMEEAVGLWLMEYPNMCFGKNYVDCYEYA